MSLLLLLSTTIGFTQTKIYNAVRIPKKYLSGNTGEILGKVGSNERDPYANEGAWIVYADRDNDTVYQDKNLSVYKTELNFLDRLFVVEETDIAVRVVRYQPKDMLKKEKGGAKLYVDEYDDLGWMYKRKLLLWQSAIIDPNTYFVKKAVPVQKLREGESDSKAAMDRLRKGKGICDFYPSPNAVNFDTTKDVNYFNYLFVFREENGRLLLSKKNDVDVGNISTNIYGWVPKSQVHLWNNSVCLRINYSPKAIAERKKKGVNPKFFPSYEEAAKFESGEFTTYGASPELAKEDELQHESSYILGFPIISTKEELKSKRIVKSGYITNVKDKNGKNIWSTDGKARIDSIISKLKYRINNVNVVFVLDGSLRSRYFGTIASSIDNMISLDKGFTSTQYSWNALVYNDNNCDEAIKLSKKDFSSMTKDGIVTWIKGQISAGSGCINNRNEGAPILQAMENASRFCKDPKKANMVIVIGTSGEEVSEERLSALVNSYSNNDISVVVFQVENKGGPVYDDFFMTMRKLLVSVAENQDDTLKKYATLPAVKLKLIGDSKFKLVNTSIPGSIVLSSAGKMLNPQDISRMTTNHLQYNQERLNKLLAKLDDGRTGSKDVDYSPEQKKELILYMLRVKSLTKEEIGVLSSLDNIQLFIEAFTVLEFAPNVGMNEPLLVRSLFMSSLEFSNLVEIIQRLSDASYGNPREKLSNAIKQIQLNYIGGNMNSKQFTFNDIFRMATGVPSYNKALKYTADDFLNETKVDLDCINALLEDFSKIQYNLEMIEKSKLYYNDRYGEKFYWVPEEFLYVSENCSKQPLNQNSKKKK